MCQVNAQSSRLFVSRENKKLVDCLQNRGFPLSVAVRLDIYIYNFWKLKMYAQLMIWRERKKRMKLIHVDSVRNMAIKVVFLQERWWKEMEKILMPSFWINIVAKTSSQEGRRSGKNYTWNIQCTKAQYQSIEEWTCSKVSLPPNRLEFSFFLFVQR